MCVCRRNKTTVRFIQRVSVDASMPTFHRIRWCILSVQQALVQAVEHTALLNERVFLQNETHRRTCKHEFSEQRTYMGAVLRHAHDAPHSILAINEQKGKSAKTKNSFASIFGCVEFHLLCLLAVAT